MHRHTQSVKYCKDLTLQEVEGPLRLHTTEQECLPSNQSRAEPTFLDSTYLIPAPVIDGISLTVVLDLGSGAFTSLNSSFLLHLSKLFKLLLTCFTPTMKVLFKVKHNMARDLNLTSEKVDLIRMTMQIAIRTLGQQNSHCRNKTAR